MSKPRSNSLFHFTKTLDTLKNILINGLYPRYCREDMVWLDFPEHIAYPIVCFCDIPLSRIDEHTDFYGQYGIGLSKQWGLKNELSPVIYCSSTSPVVHVAQFILDQGTDLQDEAKEMNEKAFWTMAKLVKPFTGKIYVSGHLVEKDFYQENEWRYTPSRNIDETIIFEDDFDARIEVANKDAETEALKFVPSDVNYIFVREDGEIPSVVDFINNNLGKYPLNDVKILTSRLISLTTIQRDL